jgi:hypothetical protein
MSKQRQLLTNITYNEIYRVLEPFIGVPQFTPVSVLRPCTVPLAIGKPLRHATRGSMSMAQCPTTLRLRRGGAPGPFGSAAQYTARSRARSMTQKRLMQRLHPAACLPPDV